jgi:hypothetical protein
METILNSYRIDRKIFKWYQGAQLIISTLRVYAQDRAEHGSGALLPGRTESNKRTTSKSGLRDDGKSENSCVNR